MIKHLLVFISLTLLVSCKGKKPDLTGDQPIQAADFIEYFPPGKLPYEISDTTLTRKEKDTTAIQYSVFTQFIPDSIVSSFFGETIKPKIFPLLRTFSGDEGTYLFAKAVAPDKRVAFLLTFNAKNEFTGAMPLLQQDESPTTKQVSGVDRKLSIFKTVFRRESDGSTSEGKEVFVHDPQSHSFMLIMTDALDDRIREIINPIDTLQKKNKFSGDYIRDKGNIVSIRDGNPGRFRFFIHIEKNKGECNGEIKGDAKFTSSTSGFYQQQGDPCAIQFNFSSSSIKITEVEACGNRRGVKCSFDGTYPRKKDPRTSVTKKK